VRLTLRSLWKKPKEMRNGLVGTILNHRLLIRDNTQTGPRPPIKLVAGQGVLLLRGVWFLAGGVTDVYRTSVLLRRTKPERESQIAEANVLSAEHPWFAFPLGRGGRIWYKVHYRFAVPEGRVVEGQDWIRTRRSYASNIQVVYQPSDPNFNRIYDRSGPVDLWLQIVVGVVCLLAGGFLVFFSLTAVRDLLW